MHDIRKIREEPAFFDQGWAMRDIPAQTSEILELDQQNRALIEQKETLLAERNRLSSEVGKAKKAGEDADAIVAKVQSLKVDLATLESQQQESAQKLHDLLSRLPNIPDQSVPYGKDESDNAFVRDWGVLPNFTFAPKQHFELGEQLGMMDFGLASALAGARFVTLSGKLARLERAIANFMIDLHLDAHELTEVNVPVLVNDTTMYNTGQLPKFADDLFRVSDDFWLIPTSEVPLTNLGANKLFKPEELPQRYTALTQCFRREAGAAGRDTRGMLRQHQFAKVEMVTLSDPDHSFDEHERMVGCAENVLKALEIPYRVVLLCSNDMGPGAVKTYDIEVWLPGQGVYREIASCSNCGPYQALRMKGRMKTPEGNKAIHTLNGSGLAVGRTLIAVMENYQQEDGSIRIPKALKPWMPGDQIIQA